MKHMDMLETLTERFTQAIRKALPLKTPLIGPKWFQWIGKERSGRFRFIGCEKLAKATKSSPKRIADSIGRNLSVDDLGVTVTVSDDSIFEVRPVAGGGKKDEKGEKGE